jgi:hypothetical protein
VSNEGNTRPSDPAGTRPKVDPASLRAVEPPPDLPWAEREQRAETRLEDAVERLEDVRVVEEPGASQHLGRFQFILGGLIAVAVLAIAAIVVVVVAGRSDQPDAAWSAWHPSGNDPLQQIADHVGASYRLENGAQIASVTGGPLEVGSSDPKVTPQLIREDPRTKQLQLQGGKTALFRLCGAAADCAIVGKASKARGLYVRREALELALYALHYTDVDQVVVTLPPDPSFPLDRAVYLRRSDVRREVEAPLRYTLPSPVPRLGSVSGSRGATLVDALTGMYAFHVEQTSDLGVIAMLGDLDTAAQALMSAATAAGTTTTPQGTSTTPQTATTPQGTSKTPQTATPPAQKAKGQSGKSGG